MGVASSGRFVTWLGGSAQLACALLGTACQPDAPVLPITSDSIAIAWRVPITTGAQSPGQGLATDGKHLYVQIGGITAFDLQTGARLWRAPGGSYLPRNLVVNNGRVFASERNARAFDTATGAELWRFTPDTLALAESAVDERAFYIGTYSRRVYALDVTTGEPYWSAEVLPQGAYPAITTGVVAQGDSLYVSLVEDASPTGHLKRGWIVALDRYTGRVLWRYANERAGESHDAGRHAVAGRVLLVNDLNGGAFFGLDRFTGKEVWRRVGPAERYGAWDTFKVADGIAYLASNDTFVYALNPETGEILWKADLRGSANSSAVCGDYVFGTTGSLYMLRRSDGMVKASLFMDSQGFVRSDEFVVSNLLAHGNRVYFVGYQALYAVFCE